MILLMNDTIHRVLPTMDAYPHVIQESLLCSSTSSTISSLFLVFQGGQDDTTRSGTLDLITLLPFARLNPRETDTIIRD